MTTCTHCSSTAPTTPTDYGPLCDPCAFQQFERDEARDRFDHLSRGPSGSSTTTSEDDMTTEPEWLTPGADVVTYDSGRGWGAPTIRPVTIDRLTPTQIILTNGMRFNRATLRERTSSDYAAFLKHPSDEAVVEGLAQACRQQAEAKAQMAVSHWQRDRADFTRARVAVKALNAFIALDSTPVKEVQP